MWTTPALEASYEALQLAIVADMEAMLMIFPSTGVCRSICWASACAEEHAGQVDGDDLVPIGLRQRFIRAQDGDAGVVHGDVQAAEVLGDAADHLLHLCPLRDVATHPQGVATQEADLFDRLQARSLVEVDNGHVGAGLGQRDRATVADAHRGAGHEGLLPGQIEQRKIGHAM